MACCVLLDNGIHCGPDRLHVDVVCVASRPKNMNLRQVEKRRGVCVRVCGITQGNMFWRICGRLVREGLASRDDAGRVAVWAEAGSIKPAAAPWNQEVSALGQVLAWEPEAAAFYAEIRHELTRFGN